MQRVARPEQRSPLFWWLLDHHDELRQAEAESGLGIPWKKLCSEFASMGITASGGKLVTAGTARITWQRVRKELARVDARRAREHAEREARRAADPRRDMPSRFPKGEYGPPLANVRPPSPQGRAVASPPRQLAVQGSATPVAASKGEDRREMELPEFLKDMRVIDHDGSALDLRQFFRNDGLPEPWDDPSLDPGDRDAEMKRVIWMRAKEWARHLPYDRKYRSKW